MATDPDQLVGLAIAVVDDVVPALRAGRRNGRLGAETKSTGTDMVTTMDRWCEKTIVEHIRSVRPTDGIVGEEGGTSAGTSGVTWVIDPIDGTTNYLYDVPGYSVSIAARDDRTGASVAGVVADPVRHETFAAAAGAGAFCNGRPLRCSTNGDLATALVGTGFSYVAETRVHQAEVLGKVIGRVRDIRRMGGAALDLCAVAAGRLDGYYERGLSEWDVAAGALIALEAGAMVSDLDGEPAWTGTVIASGPALHPGLLALVAEAHG